MLGLLDPLAELGSALLADGQQGRQLLLLGRGRGRLLLGDRELRLLSLELSGEGASPAARAPATCDSSVPTSVATAVGVTTASAMAEPMGAAQRAAS